MPEYRNTNDEWISDKGVLFEPFSLKSGTTKTKKYHDVDGLVLVSHYPLVENYDVLHNAVLPVPILEEISNYKWIVIYNYTGDFINYRQVIGHEDGDWIPLADMDNVRIELKGKWGGLQIDGDGAGTIVIIAGY